MKTANLISCGSVCGPRLSSDWRRSRHSDTRWEERINNRELAGEARREESACHVCWVKLSRSARHVWQLPFIIHGSAWQMSLYSLMKMTHTHTHSRAHRQYGSSRSTEWRARRLFTPECLSAGCRALEVWWRLSALLKFSLCMICLTQREHVKLWANAHWKHRWKITHFLIQCGQFLTVIAVHRPTFTTNTLMQTFV